MAEYIERTEELMLAMNAGARAIENTKRYHGVVYTKGLFSENPKEIPYLRAVKVLREVSDAPAADVAPVVHGRWISWEKAGNFVPSPDRHECSVCHDAAQVLVNGLELLSDYCPNCGAMMDGGIVNGR